VKVKISVPTFLLWVACGCDEIGFEVGKEQVEEVLLLFVEFGGVRLGKIRFWRRR